MSVQERKELLEFVTGSPGPPVGGFAARQSTILALPYLESFFVIGRAPPMPPTPGRAGGAGGRI